MKNMQESDEGNYAMEIKRLEAKNLELCAKLAEVKLQFRTVDGLMAVDQEIGDDGPVRRLLKLSQRIK